MIKRTLGIDAYPNTQTNEERLFERPVTNESDPLERMPGTKYRWMSEGFSPTQIESAKAELAVAMDRRDLAYPDLQQTIIRPNDYLSYDFSDKDFASEFYENFEAGSRRNLETLFDHFGISVGQPWSWKLLAFILASKHVPEFTPIAFSHTLKKGGRTVKWTRIHHIVLYAYIQFRRSEKGNIPLVTIFNGMPSGLKNSLHNVSNSSLKREYYAAVKDSNVREYEEFHHEKFGTDWVKQWLEDDQLELGQFRGKRIGGVPVLRKIDGSQVQKPKRGFRTK